MIIIGLTGGIGSGKSTVANILKEHGAVIIESDLIGKEVVEKGEAAYFEIINEFGEFIINEFGEINRKKLGEIVFSDPDKLKMLNEITHKYITKKIKERIELYKNSEIIVLEVIVPIKEGFLDVVDEVWAVVSDIKIRTKRVMKRDHFDYNEVVERFNAQKDDDFYISLADKVIKNNSDVTDLKKQVIERMRGK